MRSVIPSKIGRPTVKAPSGRWRRVMATRFDKRKYRQRPQCETVNSMIKRLLGSALRARTYRRQCREITLRTITLNVMILWRPIGGFLQSTPAPFFLHFFVRLTHTHAPAINNIRPAASNMIMVVSMALSPIRYVVFRMHSPMRSRNEASSQRQMGRSASLSQMYLV